MKFAQGQGSRIRNGVWEAGLLLALPLVFARGFAEQFSTPKIILAKCFIIAGLSVWGLGSAWAPTLRRGRFALGLPLLAFSIMALISCVASPVPRFSLMEVEFALCGPAWVLLLASWERGESAVRRVSGWMALAGSLVASIALLQRLGFDPLLLGGYQVNWESMVARMRLYSTLGNPNFVGGYLIGTVFAGLALAAAAQVPWVKTFWLSCAFIMLAAIVATGSCGAWLGLTVGLVAATMIALPKKDSRPQEFRAFSGSTMMFAAPVACWPAAILTLSLAQRVAAQLHGRFYLWRLSWPIFWQHPLIGSGWGAYQLLYLDLQGKFLTVHPEYAAYWTNHRFVHNDPLQLLLETGLLGFVAFAWILWKYGQEALAVRRQAVSAWGRYALAASVGGVSAILVDSVFNYQFAVPPTYILLFTWIAIPGLLQEPKVEREKEGRPSLPLLARLPWRPTFQVMVSVAILAAAGCLLWQQTRVGASERLYQTASDLEDHNDLRGAEIAFRRSVGLNDLNGRAHFGLSRVLYLRGRYLEALDEILRAERTYADSHQEVLRARALEQLGRDSEALAAYRHALWLDLTLVSIHDDIKRLSQAR